MEYRVFKGRSRQVLIDSENASRCLVASFVDGRWSADAL